MSIFIPAPPSTTTARSARALRSCPAPHPGRLPDWPRALIGPGVVLYENTIVGDRVIIHGGAVIGAYGFGYSHVAGRHVLSAQLGYVHIENDVRDMHLAELSREDMAARDMRIAEPVGTIIAPLWMMTR